MAEDIEYIANENSFEYVNQGLHELRMLYLQEKDSRMEFERNMNRKLENQEFAQSNLKAIITAQNSEIERLKMKDGENKEKMKIMERELKANAEKLVNQRVNENFSLLEFEKKLNAKLEKFQSEQIAVVNDLRWKILGQKKENLENIKMNRRSEEKRISLEKTVKGLGQKFADHCAGVNKSRSNLEKQLTQKIEKCKDERESAVNDLRKAIARQKDKTELLEKIDKASTAIAERQEVTDEHNKSIPIRLQIRTPENKRHCIEMLRSEDASSLRLRLLSLGFCQTQYELIRVYPKEVMDLSAGRNLVDLKIVNQDSFLLQKKI